MGYKEHFILALLVTAITTLLLGIFVVFQDKKNKLFLTFSLYSLSISWWCFAQAGNVYGPSLELSSFWARFQHIGVIFIPTFFLHFTILLLDLKYKRALLNACYVISASIALLSLPTNLVSPYAEKKVEGSINFGDPGVLYPFILLYFALVTIYCLIQIFRFYYQAYGKRKTQLGILFYSSIIGYIGGSANFFLVYDISINLLNPFGTYLVASYVLITFYAIVKHQLLDIEVIIRRAAIFAGLFAFVYAIYTCFTVLGQRFFEAQLGWNIWTSMIPTIAVIIIGLRPLEEFLTNATEKYLFQKKYDYRQLLKTFTSEVLTVLDLQKLLDKTVEGLHNIIKLESCGVFIFNSSRSTFELRASVGIDSPDFSLSLHSKLVSYLSTRKEPILKVDEDSEGKENVVLKDIYKQLKSELFLPVLLNSDLVGIISLGMKKSGEDYNQEDVDVLSSLARTEAIAISNAQLIEELSKTQAEAAQSEKMAVIGTLAAGINHEVSNPLGIARGYCEMFLLNYRDGIYKNVEQDELVQRCTDIFNKVINEVDRATGITKRLSSFAKPADKFAFSEVSILDEFNEVRAILGHELRIDNVQIISHIPESLPKIFVDKKQVQEILFNIIRNAAQAISGKGSITIAARDSNGRVFIDIEDTGSGIPKDKIKEIFNPFFTTKAPGKGTGLGLFIVKQIVERNKGTISVESTEGVGTKFTLSFETAREMASA